MSTGRLAAVLVAPSAVVVAFALLALRLHLQPPTVPHYELVSEASTAPLARDGYFALEVAPDGEVQGAVAARAFLVPPATPAGSTPEPRPWNVPMEVERDGSVRIAGPVEELFAGVAPGEWEVALAVGRPELLPQSPRELLAGPRSGADAGAAPWRVLRRRISLAGAR